MKIKVCIIVIVICFLSCTTTSEYYTGSTGSRLGINPFPQNSEWLKFIDTLNSRVNKQLNNSILWLVASYSSRGVKLNFKSKGQNIYINSEYDYNEDFFDYISSRKLDVFLLLEPGDADSINLLKMVMEKYGAHNFIKGVCIDFEWTKSFIDAEVINNLLEVISSYGDDKIIILKHWNIDSIENLISPKLVYLQNCENIKSIDELKSRHILWSRKYYPNKVGVEVGFETDRAFWSSFKNPIYTIYDELYSINKTNLFYYWNESTLRDVLLD